ncbi:MAG TPA: SseB family protein [Streptosporangiaceae bacterium]
MSGLTIGESQFRDDDGSAPPQAAAALAAFAAGQGSENAAVQALSSARLLVPVLAAAGQDRDSEMSVPNLVGADGRAAIPAFTSVAAMARWRPRARPVPAATAQVCQAAVAGQCAVVVDIAGPVPLAIDGARLAALAQGRPVPPPHQDPDVLAAVQAAAAGLSEIAGIWLAAPDTAAGREPGGGGNRDGDRDPGTDLVVGLRLAPGLSQAQARQAAGTLAERVMARLGGRLRRGITIAVEAGG